jgi:hypothetical protein
MPTQVNLFESMFILNGLKAVILILLTFYTLFSLIIIRQVDLMSRALITKVSGLLKILALVHVLFAVILIVFAYKTL